MNVLSKENLDKVFMAYDVRGLVEGELNNNFFYHLGKAVVTYLGARRLIVGRDIRETSAEFQAAFIDGARELGCSVVDIGMTATELLYFHVGKDANSDGGVIITASHNPKEWNGAKVVGKEAIVIAEGSGFEEIKELMFAQSYSAVEDTQGSISEMDPWPEYRELIRGALGPVTRELRVLVDAGNGIGGVVYDKILGDAGLLAEKLFFEPDSAFPKHDPNPKEAENLKFAIDRLRGGEFELGMAFDGDADRVVFIDRKGRIIESAYIAVLVAQYFAQKHDKVCVVHDPRITFPIDALSAEAPGVYELVQAKSGRSTIKQAVLVHQAAFGFENSGHFYFRDNYYSDSSMLTVANVLQMVLSGLDLTVQHDLWLEKYPIAGEVNFQVSDPATVIASIRAKFVNLAEVDDLDGVSVDGGDWRFNLRMSNTEALVRLNLEAKSSELLKNKYQELLGLIGGVRVNEPINSALLG